MQRKSRTQLPVWKSLVAHYESLRNVHLRQLFAEDPDRGEQFAVETAGIYLDYSKNRITDETIHLLIQLAQECSLSERIEAMFHGQKINVTEDRAVLHVALRALRDDVIIVDGNNVIPVVHEVLEELVALEPFRESGYRHLMRLHAGRGDRAEALRVYELCRLRLMDELGVGPSAETEALQLALLKG